MNRREFLKSTLTVAVLGPVTQIVAKSGVVETDNQTTERATMNTTVTRRPLRNTTLTLPLLGFGMMRLPQTDAKQIDYDILEQQVQLALSSGVNYFDTAYMYHGGESEKAVGRVLSKIPRERYFLADKMPVHFIKKASDVERFWNEQLERTQAGYFDFYLFHNMNQTSWKMAKEYRVWEFLSQKKAEGKIRHLGFSFHDSPELLAEIADAHPWDFAQIQLNYFDWTEQRAREQYEVLTSRGIPVIVMEPLRGGALAKLDPASTRVFKNVNPDVSTASWAFRYVGSLPNVVCILSGMTTLDNLKDNIQTFTNFTPLTEAEQRVVSTAVSVYRKTGVIPCTDCRYCMPCPAGVNIPKNFSLLNQSKVSGDMVTLKASYAKLTADEQAAACVECKRCLKKCPQHIDIPTQLKRVATTAAQ